MSPSAAANYYAQRANELAGTHFAIQQLGGGPVSQSSSATTATPEITRLARDLQYDPKLIYDYVHNNIDYVPYFGSLKGATLTYLDGSGNDFDQASLMIALLRASGYTASYEYGTMTISVYFACNWVDMEPWSYNIYGVFVNGGIPIEYSGGNFLIARVWVKANIDGSDYLFDPALKVYSSMPKIDIGEALGYNRNDLLAAATDGATVTADYVQDLNEVALSNKLIEYSSNLISTIRNDYPNATIEEIFGGRRIVEATLTEYQTSLPLPTVLEAAWDEIPPEYKTTLRVEHEGIDHTLNADEIGEKRLTITYAGGDYHPELRLDGELIASGNSTTLGNLYPITISIDYPYADDNGTFADTTVTMSRESGSTVAIVIGYYTGVSKGLLDKAHERQKNALDAGLADDSEALLGETLNIMALTWIKERLFTDRQILAALENSIYINHNDVVLMSQTNSFWIDAHGGLWAMLDKDGSGYDPERSKARFHAFSYGSTYEHAIVEQLMGSSVPGISTLKGFELTNTQGGKVFFADSSNFSTGANIRSQLTNYSASQLDEFESELANGGWLLVPEDGQIQVNQWTGLVYLLYDGNSLSYTIGGGFEGGYSTVEVPVNPSRVDQAIDYHASQTSSVQNQLVQASVTSKDPVDMLSGAFLYDRTDLVGGGGAPLGLAFSRSYISSLNLSDGKMGYGWANNNDIHLTFHSDSDPGLLGRNPVESAAIITAVYIGLDLMKAEPEGLLEWMAMSLSYNWAIDQLIDNAVTVNIGNQRLEFIKLPDGTYSPPPGITTKLVDNGDGTFSLQERFDRRMDFDVNDRISTLTDADDNMMTFTYNGEDLATIQDAFGRSLNFNYNEGRINSVSDSAGRSVSYSYDPNGDLVSYTDPEGKVWSYGYDAEHRMITLTNPLGTTTATNTYDSLGRVVSQSVPRQGGTPATYDLYFPGFRNIEKDPNGNETTYFYDDKGNSTGEENALGHLSTKNYDGQNHVTHSWDPRWNRTTYIYDGNDNLTRVYNAKYEITDYSYDSLFRLTDINDPLYHVTHMDYDSEHHLTLTTDAEGNTNGFTYYTNGLMETSTDGRGTTTTLTYDANGNPQTSYISSHPAINYIYDAIGRMTSLTDQVGSTTSFEYDKRDLTTSITDPLDQNSLFVYDDAGRLSSTTDRNGDTITYAYSPSGKLESLTSPDPCAVSFSYDQLDNLVQMQDELGATSYIYDAANRLTSVTDPHGFVVSYAYDEAGNLTEITYPGDKTVSYTYDALNHLETVTNWLGQTATYTYDEAGRLVTLVNFNGTVTTYGYDNANRLVDLENRKSDNSPIATYHFTLDGNGNRTNVVQNEPLVPLLSTESISYSYNTERNRLLTAGSTSFTWDLEGQLSSRDSTNFSFDAKHRLVEVAGTGTTQYEYDGADRRLEATRDGVVTRYVYDNSGNLLAEANDSNEITRYYIHGLGLLAMATPTLEVYCYHYDATGNTIAISDESQTLVNRYAYTPFGIIANQIETIPQSLKFVGQYGVMTESNGLYYMRARYYDSIVGRFISEDPSGFEGAAVNLYDYCRNNPVLNIDPSGLIGIVSDIDTQTGEGRFGLSFGLLEVGFASGARVYSTVTIGTKSLTAEAQMPIGPITGSTADDRQERRASFSIHVGPVRTESGRGKDY